MKKYKQIFGNRLISVCDFHVGIQKKTVIFVSEIKFEDLLDMKKAGNFEVPMMFTKEELIDGADVFTLGFLNIKKTYRVVYGEDLLKNLKIDKKHVRRELEFEFRSKLIHLRQEFVSITSKKDLIKLMRSAINVLAPIFHGLLYLKGHEETLNDFSDYIGVLKKLYKVDFSIIEKIKIGQFDKKSVDKDISQLIKMLKELCNIIDDIKV